jgi:hypothetical protein
MGWRFWTSDKSEAEKTLDALQQGGSPPKKSLPDYEDEIFVTVTENPVDRAPGAPLSCLNEGDTVSVGDRVQLRTAFTQQETTIVSITRDGVACRSLANDEHGVVVLADDTDLTEVYRTSYLQDAGTDDPTDDYRFLLQVHSAEQRGKDVYVVGRATGQVEVGTTTVVSPWVDARDRFAKVKSVDQLPDGSTGLLLAKRDASTIEYGDEVVVV